MGNSNVLGSAALILSTDSKQLDKGLDEAGNRIERFKPSLPKLEIPKFELPKVPLPKVDKVEAPKVDKVEPPAIGDSLFTSLLAKATGTAAAIYNAFATTGQTIATVFTQPLGKSIQQFSQFAQGQLAKLKEDTKGIGGVGGAALSTALPVVGAIISGIGMAGSVIADFQKKAMRIFDEVGSMAKQANLMGLQPQQFQEAMYGAKVDADVLTNALGHLQRQVSDLAGQNRQTERTFSQLGLTADSFDGQNSAEQFGTVAAAMQRLPTEADRARIAFQIFGRQSTELLPALREGLEAGTARAREMGLILSNEAVAGIRATQKAWKDVDQIQKGIWTQLSAAVAPAYLAVAQAGQSVWKAIGPFVLQVIEVVKAYFVYVKAGWDELVATLAPIMERLRSVFGGSIDVQGIITAFAEMTRWQVQLYATVWNTTLQIGQAFFTNIVAPAFRMAADVVDAFTSIVVPMAQVVNMMLSLATQLIQGLLNFLVVPAINLVADIVNAIRPLAPTFASVINSIISIAQTFLNQVVAPMIEGAASVARTVRALLRAVEANDPTGTIGAAAGTAADHLTTLIGRIDGAAEGVRTLGNTPVTISTRQVENAIDGVTNRLRQTAQQIRALSDGMEAPQIPIEAMQEALEGVSAQLRQNGIDADFVAEMLDEWTLDPTAVDDFFNRVAERARRAGQQVRQEMAQAFDPAMLQRAFDLGERFQDPMEKFERQFRELQQMLAFGMIDPDVFERAVDDAMRQAEQALGNNHPIQQASAMFAGSKDAANVLYQAQFGTQASNDPAERMARLQEAGNRFNARNAVAAERLVQIAENNGFGLI